MLMVEALQECGFNAVMPGGSFYLYVKAPKRAKAEHKIQERRRGL